MLFFILSLMIDMSNIVDQQLRVFQWGVGCPLRVY